MAARTLRLVHPRSGRVLADRLRVPRTFFGRGLGLMFRRELPPGQGMWITPCNGIHMFFMRFPIDVVFVDRDRKVVGVKHRLGPWRVAGARHAVAALELPAGAAAEAGVEEGDVLVLEDVESAETGE